MYEFKSKSGQDLFAIVTNDFSQDKVSIEISAFDGVTSALDAVTEYLIGKSIQKLKTSSAMIIITHRHSTAKNADMVCYMESRELLATGTFEEVRGKIPQFDNQAKLMGL